MVTVLFLAFFSLAANILRASWGARSFAAISSVREFVGERDLLPFFAKRVQRVANSFECAVRVIHFPSSCREADCLGSSSQPAARSPQRLPTVLLLVHADEERH